MNTKNRQLDALQPWKSGLLGCFSDPGSCCLTCCCPCITFGRIVRIVDKGSASCCGSGALYTLRALTGFLCFYSYVYRSKMRQQFSLEESPCDDCLVHCFCETCALCQEYRELKSRGFNMAIGWRENIASNPEIAMGSSTLGPGIDPPKVEDPPKADDPPQVDEEMSRDE